MPRPVRNGARARPARALPLADARRDRRYLQAFARPSVRSSRLDRRRELAKTREEPNTRRGILNTRIAGTVGHLHRRWNILSGI